MHVLLILFLFQSNLKYIYLSYSTNIRNITLIIYLPMKYQEQNSQKVINTRFFIEKDPNTSGLIVDLEKSLYGVPLMERPKLVINL